jgi:hypothetical protein
MLAGEIVAIPDNVDAGKMRYRKVGTRTQPIQEFRGYAFVTPEGLVIQFDAHASQPAGEKVLNRIAAQSFSGGDFVDLPDYLAGLLFDQKPEASLPGCVLVLVGECRARRQAR